MMDRTSLARKLITRRNRKESNLTQGAILTKYAVPFSALFSSAPEKRKETDLAFVSFQLKEEIELRKQMNVSELNDLDEDTRVEIEGFRTGTYVRLEIHGVPYELVEHFDPCHPILVGGIGLGEENTGYMQVSHFIFTSSFLDQ